MEGRVVAVRSLLPPLLCQVAGVLPVFLTGALAVQLKEEFGIDAGRLGLVAGSFFAAGALASVPLGRLGDRIGPARTLRLAVISSGLTMLTAATVVRAPVRVPLDIRPLGTCRAGPTPLQRHLVHRLNARCAVTGDQRHVPRRQGDRVLRLQPDRGVLDGRTRARRHRDQLMGERRRRRRAPPEGLAPPRHLLGYVAPRS